MRFYNEECPAHAALKETIKGLTLQGPPIFFSHEGAPLIDRH
jgi:hypothetical protein